VLFAKSSAEIIKQTNNGENQFVYPASYFIVLGLVVCLVLQMRLLNTGLSKADALYIVPVYQVMWVIMNTVVGMVYFQDYQKMLWYNVIAFLIGVCVTLFGVYMLSKRETGQRFTLRPDTAAAATSDDPTAAASAAVGETLPRPVLSPQSRGRGQTYVFGPFHSSFSLKSEPLAKSARSWEVNDGSVPMRSLPHNVEFSHSKVSQKPTVVQPGNSLRHVSEGDGEEGDAPADNNNNTSNDAVSKAPYSILP